MGPVLHSRCKFYVISDPVDTKRRSDEIVDERVNI